MKIKYLAHLTIGIIACCLGWFSSPAVAAAPACLFYAGFNSNVVATSPFTAAGNAVFDSGGKLGGGLLVQKGTGVPGVSEVNPYPGHAVYDPRRGSLAFWIRLNDSTYSNVGEIAGLYPGAPLLSFTYLPNRPDPKNPGSTLLGEIDFSVEFQQNVPSFSIGTLPFNFVPGDWHYVVWTWQGINHKVYLDGNLVNQETFISPFPDTAPTSGNRIGAYSGGTQNMTLDEWAEYNYPLSQAEVTAAYTSTTSGPITSIGAHGLDVTAEWGAGEGKVRVGLDSGNDYETASLGGSYSVVVTKNGTTVQTATLGNLRRGFIEGLVNLSGPLAPGDYQVTATLLNSAGGTLATGSSEVFNVPTTTWLGNTLGISSTIQPPWTPIVVNGDKLDVWGREYDLTGGYGLPVQITSKQQALLASPVSLVINGTAVSGGSVTITSSTPQQVTWTGTSSISGIAVTINGTLSYDGEMQIGLQLAPQSVPVTITSMQLETAMPSSRAVYFATLGAQPTWYDTQHTTVPTAAGTFYTNVTAHAGTTPFLPEVVFSDDDRGLEWFGQNLGGWQVNCNPFSTTPIQELIRDTNGNVRLQNDMVTQSFSLSQPINIAFGYDATPIKSLPADWRTARIEDEDGFAATRPDLSVRLEVEDSVRTTMVNGTQDWPTFKLSPNVPATYASLCATLESPAVGIKIAPYYDAHYLLPSGVDAGNQANGWADDWTGLDLIYPENRNDHTTATPSRGTADYWAYNVDSTITSGGMDAIYIDDPWDVGTMSASLLDGGGYITPDGSHGFGFNLEGQKQLFKRIRQIFINHGKRPIVWIHDTGNMYPHCWSFVDVVSDGESYFFNPANPSPDWIDEWGSPTNLPWLQSISRGEKYGFITSFLDEVAYVPTPAAPFRAQNRAMYALEQLLDISPQNAENEINYQNYYNPRVSFGITATDVTFHPFMSQTAITTDNSNVKVSYYTKGGSVLATVTNLGEAYSGNTTVNPTGMNLESTGFTAKDAETNTALTMSGNVLALTIPRHDYREILFSSPPYFFDGFESGLSNWTTGGGTPATSTVHAHAGTNSFISNQNVDYIQHNFSTALSKKVDVWFYDDTSNTNAFTGVDLNLNGGTPRFLGVATPHSTTNYCYRTTDLFTTPVARTTGWHKFTWDFTSGTDVNLYIDDTFVVNLPGQGTFNRIQLGDSTSDGRTSTVYFDDVTVY